ncbi:DUF6069 family protein [Dactylosporangium sp. NPDC048998]|uniref:DUF6069 family protein n=1 Tax=Dactylosporangium sp. NPDC048998 TaxID=3363976 RepID=UPI00371BD739
MTTSKASSDGTAVAPKVRGGRIWGAGLLAALVGVFLNLGVGLGLRAALDIDNKFLPLTPGAIVFFTFIPMVFGVLFYQILRAVSGRANAVFAIVVLGLAVLSLAAPLSLLGADAKDWEGLTTGAALALIPLHLLPAVVLVFALTRLQPR